MSETITDVVVVGGGVIGCSIAFHLRKQGMDVLVVDKGTIGSGASSAATGLLAPIHPFLGSNSPYLAFQLAGLRYLSSLVAELEDKSGVSVEYESTGTLRVVDIADQERLHAWVADWQRAGFNIKLLTDEALHLQEPLLALAVVAGIYNPDEPQLNASKLVAAYAGAAKNTGVAFQTQSEVVGVYTQGHKVNGLATSRGNIACRHVVIAAGAWSAACGNLLRVNIPVRPLRGQSLSLYPSEPLHHIVFGEGIYLAPKANGSIIVGATEEDAGFNVEPTGENVQRLMASAIKVIPTLEHCPVAATWAGLRPRSSDKRPVLGMAPDWENVVVASGHGGFGMLLSAVTGKVIADLVSTGEVDPVIQPFSLDRFSNAILTAHASVI